MMHVVPCATVFPDGTRCGKNAQVFILNAKTATSHVPSARCHSCRMRGRNTRREQDDRRSVERALVGGRKRCN